MGWGIWQVTGGGWPFVKEMKILNARIGKQRTMAYHPQLSHCTLVGSQTFHQQLNLRPASTCTSRCHRRRDVVRSECR